MKKQRQMSEIQRAIRVFLATKATGPASELAVQFIAQNRVGIEKWLAVKIARMIEREVRSIRPPKSHPYQMFLFGFAAPSVRLPLQSGITSLGKATVTQLRESLSVMQRAAHAKAKSNPKIEALAQLIEEMSPLAQMHHGLTVEKYCELRAAGVELIEKAGKAKGKK